MGATEAYDQVGARPSGSKTVVLPIKLAAVLLDAVAYPPVRRNRGSYEARVPWRFVLEARERLEDEGIDWQRVHEDLRRIEAEQAVQRAARRAGQQPA